MADIEKVNFLLHYSKYQKSGLCAADYCTQHKLDYVEFATFVNQWESIHGENVVERCMERADVTPRASKSRVTIPSHAESLFKELVVEPDEYKLRSKRRHPFCPPIRAELEHPVPGTVVREATLTFPSGLSLTFSEATIKSLILAVVLYEEADSWTE